MGVFFFVGFALGEIMVALEYMGLKAAGVKDSWRYVKKILKLSGYITFSGWDCVARLTCVSPHSRHEKFHTVATAEF